jgi:tetratricopeptide (TPR) repeat protein
VKVKRQPSPDLFPLPATPEALTLALEMATGRERTLLLNAGRARFRGNLFIALLDRARLRLGEGNVIQAGMLLEMAARLGRKGVNENAQAKSIFAIGALWHDFGQFEPAISAYRQAAQLFHRSGVAGGAARVLARWGQALVAIGKVRQAIRPYRRALRLAQSLNDTKLTAQINNNLGNAYRKASDFRRAHKVFTQAVEGARIVGDGELECTARGNLGLTEFELGRYSQAEISLREAISCARTLGNKWLEASHTGDLGNVCRALGRLAEAEEHYRRGLALAQEIGDRRYEEIGLGDLGILLFQTGRINEAIPLLEQACALSESIGELVDAARDAYHLSTVYREVGDSAAEEAMLHKCLRIAEVTGDFSLKEGALHALAYRAIATGDWSQAAIYLRQADEAAPFTADAYNAWTSPFAWGVLAYQQAAYAEAERRWAEAFRRADQAGNIFGVLNALINRGGTLIMLHRPVEAEPVLRDALYRAQTTGLTDDERLAWEAIGQARELQHDYAGARESYERALAFIESGRSALSLETHRIEFFAAREGPYVRLIRLLALTGTSTVAWEVSERARSRGFVDALARAEMLPPPSLPASLSQTERDLLVALRARQHETAKPDAQRAPNLLAELAQLRTRLHALWEEMASLAPEYIGLRQGQTLGWRDIQELLR